MKTYCPECGKRQERGFWFPEGAPWFELLCERCKQENSFGAGPLDGYENDPSLTKDIDNVSDYLKGIMRILKKHMKPKREKSR